MELDNQKCSLLWLFAVSLCIVISPTRSQLSLSYSIPNHLRPNTINYICRITDGVTRIGSCSFVFVNPRGGEKVMQGFADEDEGRVVQLYFNVTPTTEATVHCRCNSTNGLLLISDNTESIAAVQEIQDNPVQRNVIREEENVVVTLECPYMIGNLNRVLEIYHVCWRNTSTCTDNSGCCLQNSSDLQLSSDNRSLIATISKPYTNSTFQCTLRLRRCDNKGIRACPFQSSRVVVFDVNVFDVNSIDTSLMNNDESGDVTLSCAVHATNIFSSNEVIINSTWIIDGMTYPASTNNSNVSIEFQLKGDHLNSTLILNSDWYSGSTNITCKFQLFFSDELLYSKTMKLNVLPPTTTGPPPTSTPPSTIIVTPSMSSSPTILPIAVAVPAAAVIFCFIVILGACCYFCYRRKKQTKDYDMEDMEECTNESVRQRPKKVPIYEELPCGPIFGTEPYLMRQCGIEYDPTLSKHENGSYQGSDEPLCGGSDVSGLSGVSGNIRGPYKMPSYNAEDSVVSDNLLQPPQPWNRNNVSNSTFNSTATQSTVLGSSSLSDVPHTNVRLCSSEIHYRHGTGPLPERRYSCTNHPPASFTDGMQQDHCHSCSHQIPFNNTTIVPSVASSNSSLHKPISTASSKSNSVNNSPYHHSVNNSPYHHSVNNSPYHHSSTNASPCHQTTSASPCHHSSVTNHVPQESIAELASYLLNRVQHNRNCKLPGCFCKSLKDLNNIEDIHVCKTHNIKRRKTSTTVTSSSTESESDTPDHKTKKKTMKLELKKEPEEDLYPHYHLSIRSHVIHSAQKRVNSKKRRSQSLTDLTPITEMRETPTPMVGGPVMAGTPVYPPKSLGSDGQVDEHYVAPTKQALLSPGPVAPLLSRPRPPLLRQTSISIDNIPVLCLNDCVAKLTTPSPTNHSIYLMNKVGRNGSALKTVQETANNSESEGSNTSSRSRSPKTTSSLSDCDDLTASVSGGNQESSLGRYESLGYESGEAGSLRSCSKAIPSSYGRVESSGYESGGGSISGSKPRAKKVNEKVSKTKNGLKSRASPVPDLAADIGTSKSLLPNSSTSPKENLIKPIGTQNSPVPSRSPSPFETETEVRDDGAMIQTTEC